MNTLLLPVQTNKNNKHCSDFKSSFAAFMRQSYSMILLLTGMLFYQQGFSQVVTLTNPASPFVVPAGVTSIKIEVWGGGGAGGGSQNTFLTTRYGGGGGGGGYSVSTFSVVAGQSYNITRGAGGTAVDNANGNPGNASSVSGAAGTVTAGGGAGGVKSTASTGGSGGTGTLAGGAGGTGSGNGAGGGGAAGNLTAGGAGSNTAAGTGGTGNPNVAPYIGGIGGAPRTSTGDGNDGVSPGGGGGGGRSNTTTAAGGDGAAGQVLITYTCPTYSLTNPTTAASPVCSGSTSSVILSSSAAGLPAGTYTVTYNLSAPNAATGLTASMVVSTAGSGSFTTAALANGGATTLTITSLALTSVGCTSTITANNTAVISVNAAPSITVGTINSICAGSTSFTIPYSALGNGANQYSISGTNISTVTNAALGVAPGSITVNLTAGASGASMPFALTVRNSSSGCVSAVINSSVTVNALPQGSLAGGTICNGGTGQLTFTASAGTGPYTVIYNDGVADRTATGVVSATAFNVFTNPTNNANYTLVSVQGSNGCLRSSGFTGSSATITVRPTPTATISGTTTVCQNATSPNIVFTNPQNIAVTITYNINAGANTTVNVNASASANVTASTATAGSFTYNLVNVFYQNAPTCLTPVAGSAVVTVNALPTAFTVGGGGTYCSSGAGVTVTLNGSQTGIDYQLLNGASPVATQSGTGLALSFNNVTAAGTYTIFATNTTTSCGRAMTGNATVSVNPVPVINSVTASPSPICSGGISTLTATAALGAGTPSLGAGTTSTDGNSTSATLGPNPFEDYYGGSKQQMLITAAELTSMGLINGSQISGLQIQLSAANTGYALQNFRVKIQATALTALTSTFVTGGTTVFGPANYTPSGVGYNAISFSSNFTWNGTSNLIIETNYSNNNNGSSGTTEAVYGTTSFVSTAFYRFDNRTATQVDAQTSATYTYSARNNIKLNATVLPAITWSPVTALYSNAAATTAYTAGQNLAVVYSKAATTTTYTATATNGVGCTAGSPVTLTVNQPPAITGQPVNKTVCENGSVSFSVNASGTGITYQWRRGATNLTNTGNISGANSSLLIIDPVALSNAGSNYNVVITGTAPCTSVTSNNVSLTVNTAPGLVCPSNDVVNATAGQCYASRTYSAVATGSPAPTISYLVGGNFITFPYNFPVGVTTVSVLAEGACAPDATCNFTVTVNDIQAPIPDLANLTTVTGECSATVPAAPTATDACDGLITGTTSDPLTYNSQGTFTIHWNYTDSKGNTASQTQSVVVHDVSAPVPNIASLPDANGECSVTVGAPAATDNCVGSVTGTTADPVSYSNQGTFTIHWNYNDGNGNVSTQTQTVIVDDITAPVADVAVLPAVSGECTATASAPAATDNCVGSLTGTTADPLTYNTPGTYIITWSYDDGNGNVSTQTQSITVTDVNAPVPNIASLPDATGECSITVAAPMATDACAGSITGTTTDPLTYNAQGTFTINWTYDDGHGNISSQTQTVIVDDITAPVADIANLPNATGECSVIVSAPTATDNCVGSVTGSTTDPITYNTQGTYTITWNYNDGNGNVSSQTQTVVVADATAPAPDVATLATVTGECSATIAAAPTATDNCVGSVTGTTTDALTYNAQGTYTITWNYNDGNGNVSTQTQTVIVDDVTAPVADVATLATITGECSATVSNVPTATDNCAGLISGTTTDPLTYNTQGTYTINWSYNDGNGNISTQTQTLIIDDITAPVADAATLATITGECAATVSSAPTATDNCVGSVTGTTTDPLTYNTQGTFIITWSYDDGNGNASTQTQTLVVEDVTAPVADIASLSDATGECSVTVSAPTATDNCVGSVTGTTTDPLTYTTQGTFVINWTYNDGNGNLSTQTQTVVVDDITAPVADVASLPDATGECSVTVSAPTATDNCVGSVTGATTDPLTYNTQGTFTIHWTYNDGNGNVSTQTQTVVVDDITAPVANVASLSNATGECSVTVSAPTATDNCVGSVTGTTTDPLTYNAQGTYMINWSYDDGNGNISMQTQTVIVQDVTAPVITCPSAQVFCSAPGNNYSIPLLVASDNCALGAITYEVSGATTRSGSGNNASGTFNVGTSTILWTVADINNNSSSCSVTVTVNIPPTAPGSISGPANVCAYAGTGEQITYTINPVANATGYQWTVVPAAITIISGQGTTSLTVTINAGFANTLQSAQRISVKALSACGNSIDQIKYLVSQTPSTPGVISGPTSICALIGTGNTATYTINKVIAATSYGWTIPATGVTAVHPNGAGINDTVIVVTYASNYVQGNITVAAANNCGTNGSVRSLLIPRTSASVPGLISGPTNVCAYIAPNGTEASYSINAVQGATSYNWSVPPGSQLVHVNAPGVNDTAINVRYPSGFSSGSVSVSATNGCGTSAPRSLAISKLNPATPGVIDVIQTGFCPNRQYSYTVSSMPANATYLQWTIPSAQGAVLVSQTATSITVSYPSTAVNGTVSVKAFNNCGSSTLRSTAVKLPTCPPDEPGRASAPALPVTKTVKTPVESIAIEKMDVKLFPNPSVSDFNLQVITAGKDPINVRILDMQGRSLKQINVMPFQKITIGAELKAGSYFIETRQGKEVKTVKVIKF